MHCNSCFKETNKKRNVQVFSEITVLYINHFVFCSCMIYQLLGLNIFIGSWYLFVWNLFLMIYVNKMYTFTHISLKDNCRFFRVHPRGTMNICTVAHSRDFPGHGYSWKVIQLNLFSCLAKDPELKVNRMMKLVVLHPYSLNIKQTYIKVFFGGGDSADIKTPPQRWKTSAVWD